MMNSHISIKVFNKDNVSYNEVSINGQDNSIASLFFDPIIRHTNIKFDINEVLNDNEIKIINMKDINEFTISSDLINASILLEMMQKIYDNLFFLGGIVSETLEIDLNDIDSLSVDEKSKKDRKENIIVSYMMFADTFGKFIGILKVAKSLNSSVQIEVAFG